MGVFNAVVMNCDSLNFPELQIKVDYILLDAPCSGTGLKLAKNKRLEQRHLKDIIKHSKIQQGLLDIAWSQLKTGGTMVYSTCSLEPEEGEVPGTKKIQSAEFFRGTLETEEDVDAFINELRKTLIKIILSGQKIVLE